MFSNCWFRFIEYLGFQIDDYNSVQVIVLSLGRESTLLPKVHRKTLGQSCWGLPAG